MSQLLKASVAVVISVVGALSDFSQEPKADKAYYSKTISDSDIAKLIHRLGSNDFKERETASRALRAIGLRAIPLLQKASSRANQSDSG
jgi:hypothetical protein